MRFEWDEASFETAALVFDDPHATSSLERVVDGEERWQTLGMIGSLIVVMVAHTYGEEGGDEVIRIISARKATPHERRAYEETYKGPS